MGNEQRGIGNGQWAIGNRMAGYLTISESLKI